MDDDESTVEGWMRGRGQMEVLVTPGLHDGYDVVLRVDGGYYDRDDAARVAAEMARQLRDRGLDVTF